MAATSNNRVRFDSPSSAYIEDNPPFHGWVRFKFKTLPPKLAYKWRTEIEGLPGDESFDKMVELIASRVTSWSEDRELTKSEVEQTPWLLVRRMANILVGQSRGDTDPDTGEKTETAEEHLGKS